MAGALDWKASAVAMWVAQACSVLVIGVWSQGGTTTLSLRRLWGALALLFAAQIVAGVARIASGTGPWFVLRRGIGSNPTSISGPRIQNKS